MIDNRLKIGSNEPEMLRYGSRMVDSVCIKTPVNAFDPILNISAKGLTTEGIKQENGILDLSGNGNHATGIDNISVVNDDDLGECFDFNNGCIEGNLTYYKTLSVAFTLKRTGNGRPYGAIWLSNQKDYGYLQISISSDTLSVSIFDGSNWDYSYVTRLELPNPDIGEYHHYAFTVDATNKKLGIYIDGTLYQEVPFAKNYGYNKVTEPLTSYRIGRLSSTYYTQIRIQNFFVYPRALNEHQIQALYSGTLKLWENLPSGAVLDVTARGLTTAGIAENEGVTDLSGNGNNGTAYGGVEVVNDSEMGECFSFNGKGGSTYGANGCHIRQQTIKTVLRGKQNFSFGGVVKPLRVDYAAGQTFFSLHAGNGDAVNVKINATNNKLAFEYRGGSNQLSNIVMEYGKKYVVYCVGYQNPETPTSTIVVLYCDGVEVARRDVTNYSLPANVLLSVGGYMYGPVYGPLIGLISDIKIFPYALTPQQVKRLYHFACYPKNPVLDIDADNYSDVAEISSSSKFSIVSDNEIGTSFQNIPPTRNAEYVRSKKTFAELGFDVNTDMTLFFKMKIVDIGKTALYLVSFGTGYNTTNERRLSLYASGRLGIMWCQNLGSYSGLFNTNIGPFNVGDVLYIALVQDIKGGSMKLYINNNVVASGNFTAISNDGFLHLRPTFYTYYTYTEPTSNVARISNIKIYPRALTSEEVKSLYLHSHQYMLDHHGI